MAFHKTCIILFLSLIPYLSTNAMEQQQAASEPVAGLQDKATLTCDSFPAVAAVLNFLIEKNLADKIIELLGKKDPHIQDNTKKFRELSTALNDFTFMQIARLVDLIKLYDLPTIFTTDRAEGYSLLVDFLYWVHYSWIYNYAGKFDKITNLEELKSTFENDRAQYSIALVSEENTASRCNFPERIVAQIDNLAASFEGPYAASKSRPLILQGGYQKNTLTLLKRVLFIIYHYHLTKEARASQEDDITVNSGGPHIDDFLVNYLRTYLEQEACETELALTEELLTLAVQFNIKVLIHAIIRILENSCTIEIADQIADALPLDYFPDLFGFAHTDVFILTLLGIKLCKLSLIDTDKKTQIPEIVARCIENFMRTLVPLIAEGKILNKEVKFYMRGLMPSVANVLKQKLLAFCIPNYKRVWDTPWHRTHSFKHWLEPPLQAVRFDNTIAFMGSAPANHIAFHKSPAYARAEYQNSSIKEKFAVNVNEPERGWFLATALAKYKVALAMKSGTIEIRGKKKEAIVIGATPRGNIKGMYSGGPVLDPQLLVSYDSGAFEAFGVATGKHVCELNPPGTAGIYVSSFNQGTWSCSAYTDGTIKVQRESGELERIIKVPQLMRQRGLITCLQENENMLFVGTKLGEVYCIDLTTGKVIKIYQAHYGPVRLCSTFDRFMAVAYEDKRVVVWDLITGTEKKTIVRSVPKAPVGVQNSPKPSAVIGMHLGMYTLEIIYDDRVVDHHIIPEILKTHRLLEIIQDPSLIWSSI